MISKVVSESSLKHIKGDLNFSREDAYLITINDTLHKTKTLIPNAESSIELALTQEPVLISD